MYQARWRDRNRDKLRASYQKYREKNREAIREQGRRYRMTHFVLKAGGMRLGTYKLPESMTKQELYDRLSEFKENQRAESEVENGRIDQTVS